MGLKNRINSKAVFVILWIIVCGLVVDIAIVSRRQYLHRKVALGDYGAVSQIIESRHNINNKTLGYSALHVAVEYKEIEIARLLLENGANVNDVDYMYETALHKAVKAQDINMVKLLISHDANKESKNLWGDSILDYAKSGKNIDILKLIESF